MGASGIQSVKIARAMFVDGRALVGLNLSPSDVPNVKQRLGIGTPLGEASAAEILSLVVGGAVIELDNGWRLTGARMAGDEVIEVVLNGMPANREELRRYGLSEEIVSYKRRWFAVLDEAPAVLPRLLTQRSPIRDVTATESFDGSNGAESRLPGAVGGILSPVSVRAAVASRQPNVLREPQPRENDCDAR